MRKAFIDTLVQLAEKDERIYLLTADMGFGLVEPFAEKYPGRFINVGVAEQNMVGIATGLALTGKIVFCYSIANFPTLRCLEQIRNDICYHAASVVIVSGSTGLWYGALGMTHHSTEDIAIMRSLPNMTVVSPGDARETGLAMNAIVAQKRPCYLRLGKSPGDITPESGYQLGKASVLFGGRDITMIATGGILYNATQAAITLRRRGIGVRVLDMHTIKPLDVDAVKTAALETKVIMTIEEHSLIGGLGSAVAEVLSGMGEHAPLRRMGVMDGYPIVALSYDQLLATNRLTIKSITEEALDAIH